MAKEIKAVVVDDDEFLRELVRDTLKAIPEVKKVAVFENGSEAFKNFQKINPDIIFSDNNMPVMNGIELLEKLAENGLLERDGRRIIFVLMTGLSSLELQEKARRLGCNEFVEKPFSINTIWKIVGKYFFLE